MKKFRLTVAGNPGHNQTVAAEDRGEAAIKALGGLGFEIEEIPEPKAAQLELALDALETEMMDAVAEAKK